MTQYIIRRVLWMLPVLFTVTLLTFIIMHATPGGPWDISPDSRTNDPRLQERLNRQYGLDLPLYINVPAFQEAIEKSAGPLDIVGALFNGQFEIYLGKLLRGDLGPSYRYRGLSVNDILFSAPENDKPFWESRMGTTGFLGILAMTFALVIGFPLGLVAGLKQNTLVDNLSLLVVTGFYGIPSFVTGIFFIFVFAVWLGVIRVLEVD